MAHGEFAWNELLTRDVERAKAFYGAVFGWTFDSFNLEGSEYWVAKTEDAAVAGIGPVSSGAIVTTQSYWLSTIEVEDVDTAVAMAASLGAAILQQAHDVPGIGRFAVMRDPNGAVIGMLAGADPQPSESDEATGEG